MSPESLPVKLRQARRTMSLAEAAERSGIPEHRIRMYEEGERQPYRKTLKRLAEAYGVPIQEFLGNGEATRSGRKTQAPAAQPRRRRRRPRAHLTATGSTLQIPVEVENGQVVRLVIELVIRPQSTGVATSDSTIESDAVTDGRAGAARDLDTDRPRGETPARKDPWPARVPAFGAPSNAHGLRSPIAAAPSDPTRSAPSDARDPLMEFRRAYREFRRDKK